MNSSIEKRVYNQERDFHYPEIDIVAQYLVKNKTQSPIPLCLRNESGTQTETLVLASHGSVLIEGNRMTYLIFELERKNFIKVTKQAY